MQILWGPIGFAQISFAFQLHAFRNRWKGRVLAGGMGIVFNLFLALLVIYFSGQYVRVCILF